MVMQRLFVRLTWFSGFLVSPVSALPVIDPVDWLLWSAVSCGSRSMASITGLWSELNASTDSMYVGTAEVLTTAMSRTSGRWRPVDDCSVLANRQVYAELWFRSCVGEHDHTVFGLCCLPDESATSYAWLIVTSKYEVLVVLGLCCEILGENWSAGWGVHSADCKSLCPGWDIYCCDFKCCKVW
jgi:hypothetical protein